MQIAIGYCLVKRFGSTQMNTTHTGNERMKYINNKKKKNHQLSYIFVFLYFFFKQTLFQWNFNLLSEFFLVNSFFIKNQTFRNKKNN